MDWLTFLSKLVWPGLVIFIVLRYQKEIGEFLGTLKYWKKIVYPGGSVDRENREDKVQFTGPTTAGERSLTKGPSPEDKDLPPEAIKVLSTLWKHQQQYFSDPSKGRWSFAVGSGHSLYPDYVVGVGELIKRGLARILQENGQSCLTDMGIAFCLENQGLIAKDWNYQRWSQ